MAAEEIAELTAMIDECNGEAMHLLRRAHVLKAIRERLRRMDQAPKEARTPAASA